MTIIPINTKMEVKVVKRRSVNVSIKDIARMGCPAGMNIGVQCPSVTNCETELTSVV